MQFGEGVERTVRVTFDSIFIVAQVALMLGLSAMGDTGFIRSVAATTLLWTGYAWIENKYGLYMNNYVRAIVLLAIISDGFFGYYLGYYVSSVVFDKLQHIFGSYAFALFAYVLTVQRLIDPLPQPIASILIVSLGVSIGAFYEIAEFLVDTWGSPILPSQPSLLDTNLDLIGDAVGALIAALHCNFVDFVGNRFSN